MQGEVPTWHGPHTPPLSQKCLRRGCRRFHLGEKTGAGVSLGGLGQSWAPANFTPTKQSRQTKELSLLHSLKLYTLPQASYW